MSYSSFILISVLWDIILPLAPSFQIKMLGKQYSSISSVRSEILLQGNCDACPYKDILYNVLDNNVMCWMYLAYLQICLRVDLFGGPITILCLFVLLFYYIYWVLLFSMSFPVSSQALFNLSLSDILLSCSYRDTSRSDFIFYSNRLVSQRYTVS